MLENYYVQPKTVDQIRLSWVYEPIEQYVFWLASQGYSAQTVRRRIPILVQFGEFAWGRGARTNDELPGHVGSFVSRWVRERGQRSSGVRREKYATEIRTPLEQMLTLTVPGYIGTRRTCKPANPFEEVAPRLMEYLADERGLKPRTVLHYWHYLNRFGAYLQRIGLKDVTYLSPTVISGFIADYGPTVSWSSLRNGCGTLRVFLRYLYREGVIEKDLSGAVEAPQSFRLSGIPRSITWEEVERVLGIIDRRTPTGKRDYAILLLLVTYGLRAGEVAGLRLDDIDWRSDRLRIPERKAGHSTAYPLSSVVGDAILAYLKHGRPQTKLRHIFLRVMAPVKPLGSTGVSLRAGKYLRQAGVQVYRPGAHTLRHTCVQRLVDADFSLTTIGDYVGHRSPSSTQIYSKVAIEALRQVAIGNGEEVL